MHDLVIHSARVVDPLNGIDAIMDVAVDGGKIAEVAGTITSAARETVDAAGLVLQPGIIDAHVHLGSMWGSPYGAKMLAMAGVTTCLDMAGPLDEVLDSVPVYGTGLNIAILQYASPPYTFKNATPSVAEMTALIDESLSQGALGIKLLGGHYPLTPAVSRQLIGTALSRRAYIAWHAGTTEHGSNIEGMLEAVEMANGRPLHLAHINAYCRGAVDDEIRETRRAIDALIKNPNIFSESYISPKNGTSLACDAEGRVRSHVTANCLRQLGFSTDADGIRAAIAAGKAFVIRDTGEVSELVSGKAATALWEAAATDTGGSFNINPPIPRVMLAVARRPDGTFVVDAISTDGGCIPRNVILSQGLSLVKLDVLSLSDFVRKTALNPARMLRLPQKGHLTPGADADLTLYDLERQRPVATWVAGQAVLKKGRILGRSARVICTERGQKALGARGLETIVVDPGRPVCRAL